MLFDLRWLLFTAIHLLLLLGMQLTNHYLATMGVYIILIGLPIFLSSLHLGYKGAALCNVIVIYFWTAPLPQNTEYLVLVTLVAQLLITKSKTRLLYDNTVQIMIVASIVNLFFFLGLCLLQTPTDVYTWSHFQKIAVDCMLSVFLLCLLTKPYNWCLEHLLFTLNMSSERYSTN